MPQFHLPTEHFRSLAGPAGTSRFGLFFVDTTKVPKALYDWREVNPREVNQRSHVYKAITRTLAEDPERFHERNRGLTIVASRISYDEKKHEVILQLDDTKLHGVVDGAHTLHAILNVEDPLPLAPAFVFMKVIVGVDPDQIAEIAGGLNTSQMVDLTSLENLREHFDELRAAIASQPYAGQVAYKMNEEKAIDVREILYYLAVFDCDAYNDKRHPVALFGRKEGIVRKFAEQATEQADGTSFSMLISKATEILRLRDLIEKCALQQRDIGRYKAGKDARVRSESHRDNHLPFLNETVNGKIPLGWLMPMLAGFRANVLWNKPKGSFSWAVPIDELVDACIEDLVLGIKDVHEQENSRPEYVGRNTIAWRMSYNVVAQAILKRQLYQARNRD